MACRIVTGLARQERHILGRNMATWVDLKSMRALDYEEVELPNGLSVSYNQWAILQVMCIYNRECIIFSTNV